MVWAKALNSSNQMASLLIAPLILLILQIVCTLPSSCSSFRSYDDPYDPIDANHRIRAVNLLDGNVRTLAGNGSKGSLRDGPGLQAEIRYPHSILFDAPSQSLYVSQAHCLRKVSLPDGYVTTQAGTFKEGHTADGVGSLVTFFYPSGIAMSPSARELILLDRGNHTIHRLPLAPLSTPLVAGGGGVAAVGDISNNNTEHQSNHGLTAVTLSISSPASATITLHVSQEGSRIRSAPTSPHSPLLDERKPQVRSITNNRSGNDATATLPGVIRFVVASLNHPLPFPLSRMPPSSH
jgi:hypothetical protein